MHSAVLTQYSVCLSVCDALQYRAHIGWNSSKIISRPNTLRLMRWLTPTGPTWAIWCNGNTPKLVYGRIEVGPGGQKSCHISKTMQDRTEVTITD